jgi:outer membrane protein assembly factor BamA
LRYDSAITNLLQMAGANRYISSQGLTTIADWQRVQNKVLTYAENNGYPFAEIGLTDLRACKQFIEGTISYRSGTLIRFDTLIVIGQGGIKPVLLQTMLGIYPGQLFNQAAVRQAEELLKMLPFLRLLQAPDVLFRFDRAHLVLHLAPIQANQFDGIVGFLPNQERQGSILLTGMVNLQLRNLFNGGKSLLAEWQRMRTATQSLKMSYEHPLLFRTRLNAGLQLNFLKEDTTFFNLQWQGLLSYPLLLGQHPVGKIGFFVRNQTSVLTDSSRRSAERGLANTRFLSYGINYQFSRLDNLLRPQSGWHIGCEAGAGNKSAVQRTPQGFATLQLVRFISTGKQTALMLRANSGIMLGRSLFLNELFRMGGLQTLRGFNENTFFASRYLIGTVEYRLYFEESSFIFAFADYGRLAEQTTKQSLTDAPLGAGFGINVGVKGGIFSLTYAMGNSARLQQTFSLEQSKIHFGYVSRF